jgi:hypothetical protein
MIRPPEHDGGTVVCGDTRATPGIVHRGTSRAVG